MNNWLKMLISGLVYYIAPKLFGDRKKEIKDNGVKK